MANSDSDLTECNLCQTEDNGYFMYPTELSYKTLSPEMLRWKNNLGSFPVHLEFVISSTESFVEFFTKILSNIIKCVMPRSTIIK